MQHTKQPAKKTEERAERKQVGIHVDVALWRKFRAKAMEDGKQAGQLVEELVADYLARAR